MCADQSSFPLAGLEAVANAQHQWVALAMTPAPGADPLQTLLTLLSYPDVGAALARARAMGQPTVPSTLGEERTTNPMLRATDPALKAALGLANAPDAEVFTHIRSLKDKF